jgi:2,4-dienoyl-CoA reductase-like NADH-dependent reductase (Old Yellow Enzyme family)
MDLVVRLSAFDMIPFRKGENGRGVPEKINGAYRHAFGCDPREPTIAVLDEAEKLLVLLRALNIDLVCISAGSPYYVPHIQRPALFPPSDGYLPPEDPLVGVARQMEVTARLKKKFSDLLFVGSGYTYLQEYLPHVGQAAVREGWTDFVGIGRLVLSYPDLPADILENRPLKTAQLCRTFSDCTTAPRNGLVSGCFPFDPLYQQLPDAVELKAIKERLRQAVR